jgi:hypothetical protein
VGGAINQMFTRCCGHATIVARKQPLSELIENRRGARPDRLDSRGRAPGPSQPERARAANFSADSQSAIRITSLQQLIARSPCAMRAPKIKPPDINRARNGSRHFCAAGTFCASFRHARVRAATRADSGVIFHTQDRTTSYAICRRRSCFPSELRHAPKDWPHERLSRHHIAPAARKSAARTSSHGPVWLFNLRCG